MRLAFAVFCAAAILLGQGAEPKLGKIEGRVVHSVTGMAVPRVSLTLMPMPTGQQTGTISSGPPQPAGVISSGDDGSFSFANVPAGSYQLRGERNGFQIASYGSGPLRVSEGQGVTGLTFKLTPQSVVAVKVLDMYGDPVNRAMVQAQRTRFVGGQRTAMTVGTCQTDDLGECRLSTAAGTYYLTATTTPNYAMGIPPRQPGQTADEIVVTTYYPSATDQANASPITLGAGQTLPILINLRKGRAYRVRGSVSADLARSQLTLMPKNRELMVSWRSSGGMVQADGSFELSGVAPGSYYLSASRPGVNTMTNPSLRAAVEVGDRDVDGVAFQSVESVTLKGRVIFEGSTEKDKVDYSRMRVLLAPLDGLLGGATAPELAADGTFTLSNVAQGRYQARFLSTQPGYLKTVRYGQLDVTNSGIDLNGVTSPSPIEIIYSRKAATVNVTVVRDSPERDPGMVLLVPDSPQGAAPASDLGYVPVLVNPTGMANAQSVAPGKYRVYALEVFEGIDGVDPTVLKRLESKSASITVAEGETATVSVKQLLPADLETR